MQKMCAYELIGQRGPNLQIHTSYLRILLEAKILSVFTDTIADRTKWN